MTAAERARMWRHAREQLTAWLPAMLMALFALGSWWLIRSAPELAQLPQQQRAVTHEPDYTMDAFVVRAFDPEGALESELRGRLAEHYPDDDTLHVTEPRADAMDRDGLPIHAHADRGVANHDGSEIQLYGNARIVRAEALDSNGRLAPEMEFQGEYLRLLHEQEYAESDRPVTLSRGADRFRADAMDYDNRTGVAHLRGNVRGLIPPAVASTPSGVQADQ